MSDSSAAILSKLMGGSDLTWDEASSVMEQIATGAIDPLVTSAFLVLLQAKGETSEEIAALASVMRRHVAPVSGLPMEGGVAATLVDIVGTGGDGHHTVNISTAAAIVAAACGARVAKHGNRSVSSKSGSADVLEALGVRMLAPEHIGACIGGCGIAFMFAPKFHPAMKHVVPVRKTLGVRTVFNILGPLLNPAGAMRLMLGVYTPSLLQTYGEVLHKLGVEHAIVVHCCGLDELAAVGVAEAVEVTPAGVTKLTIDPAHFGIPRCTIADLGGGDCNANAAAIRAVLGGGDASSGPIADTIALNAGAALYVYGSAASIGEGYATAIAAMRDGTATTALLNKWGALTVELEDGSGSGAK